MTTDKKKADNPNRQKIMIIAFAVIGLIILWQMMSMFGHEEGGDEIAATDATQATGAPAAAPPAVETPKPAEVPKQSQQQPTTQREAELMQLQQQTEQKYIQAMNELQMLKLTREIAETNQAIISAKLATVTAQKNIIEMLAPPPEPSTPTAGDYAQGLAGAGVAPQPTGGPSSANTQAHNTTSAVAEASAAPTQEIYTVISVSQLQQKWTAVIGYKQRLLSVAVGDVLDGDNSKVVSIDRSGVTLMKDGEKRKISMVPII